MIYFIIKILDVLLLPEAMKKKKLKHVGVMDSSKLIMCFPDSFLTHHTH